jgi:glycerate kinase
VRAVGSLGDAVETFYGIIERDGERTAVIEAANICGLTMVPPELRNPMHTTTRGIGEVIGDALNRGIRSFVIGLGGSATNDGGLGMLNALGVRYVSGDGKVLAGFGRELAEVARVDVGGLDPRIGECRITIAYDVTNPLLGENGATYVYGPQKGAGHEDLAMLEQAMAAYADVVEAGFARACRDMPGAGAAGGLGFALMLLGGSMVPGAQVIERMTGLSRLIAEADWVITGEGRSDGQTLYGKLPMHVARLAQAAGKPAILISGSLGPGSERLNDCFTACFPIVRGPASLEECIRDAKFNLHECARQAARLIHRASGLSG